MENRRNIHRNEVTVNSDTPEPPGVISEAVKLVRPRRALRAGTARSGSKKRGIRFG